MVKTKRKIISAPKKVLTPKEQHIVELAKISWSRTQKEFFFPPLDMPNFIFDYSNLEGFYIDPENKWKIAGIFLRKPLF